MFFRDVVGQEKIRQKLQKNARDGRVSHALMFTGPSGSGKLAMALAFAQYVNCLEQGEDDSCGRCTSCLKSSKLVHPDIHFIFPVNSSKDVKEATSDTFLPAWREMILESPYFSLEQWYEKIGIENKQGIIKEKESQAAMQKLSLVAFEGKYRIMLIWCAEKMNTTAANKLLKILEEPLPGTLFLLITDDQESLLPTIVSRTQLIHLPPVSDDKISRFLQDEFKIDSATAAAFTSLADGNYTLARTYAADAGESEDFTGHFINWMRLCWTLSIRDILGWVEQTAAMGREKQKAFLVYSLHIVRESLNMHFGDLSLQRMTSEENEFMLKFHAFINGSTGPVFAADFNEACYHIERNANPKILFLDLSLRVIKLLKAKA